MTAEHSRITLDPTVLAGKPVIRGTRLSVEFVIGLMAEGWKEADIMIAGGTDALISPFVVACFGALRARKPRRRITSGSIRRTR